MPSLGYLANLPMPPSLAHAGAVFAFDDNSNMRFMPGINVPRLPVPGCSHGSASAASVMLGLRGPDYRVEIVM